MVKVVTYGTLKRGFPYHDILSSAEFIGEDTITGKYNMYDLGLFPAIVVDGDEDKTFNIEVYEADEATQERLDWLEGYTPDGNGLYDKISVTTDNGSEAIMYVMKEAPVGADKIGGWTHEQNKRPD